MNVATQTLADAQRIESPAEVRRAIRSGAYAGWTTGVALGYLQANLAILPADYADDFLRFCHRNPRPCPVLAVSEVGSGRLPGLGEDLDVKTDLSSYNVWRDGEHTETVPDLSDLWRDDLVAFAIGCSLSWEEALLADDMRYRVLDAKTGIRAAVYDTSIDTVPAGPFGGKMVVSMRPFTPVDAIRAVQITSRFPAAHGQPVHLGDPGMIGVADLVAEDLLGGAFEIWDDEIPVFWGCGVTPQRAIAQARPPLAFSHTPAHMLVTDVPSSKYAVM